MKIEPIFCAVCCAVLLTGNTRAAGSIEIETFVIAPMQFERDGSFELGVTVKATEVPIVSYVLRTSRPVERKEAPPSFDHFNETRKLASMQEDGQVHLQDNGAHDLDPNVHAFRLRVDTQDWPLGRHDLVLFAHNRPGTGNHVKDYRMFVVWIEENGVRVIDQSHLGETRFTQCEVVPAIVEIGDKATLRLAWAGSGAEGVEVRQPFYVRPEQSPAPFTYDEKHVSYLMHRPMGDGRQWNCRMENSTCPKPRLPTATHPIPDRSTCAPSWSARTEAWLHSWQAGSRGTTRPVPIARAVPIRAPTPVYRRTAASLGGISPPSVMITSAAKATTRAPWKYFPMAVCLLSSARATCATRIVRTIRSCFP